MMGYFIFNIAIPCAIVIGVIASLIVLGARAVGA
jgi:hypothetical protein